MNNSTFDSNQSDVNVSLIELLDALGFIQFDVMMYQFVMPVLGCIGIVFGSFSVVILFNIKKFNMPLFDYYRVLSVVDLALMLCCVTYGFCITPEFFPSMESHWCVVYQMVYIPFSSWQFYYVGCIELGMLLERMKIFRPFVKRYFTISPRLYCLIFAVVCFVINGLYMFVFVPSAGDTYYYIDKKGVYRQNKFYYVSSSNFAVSKTGHILLIGCLVLVDIVTMIVSVTLNIVLFIQMKLYFRDKEIKFKMKRHKTLVNTQMTVNALAGQALAFTDSHEVRNVNTSNKNHTLMVLSLCFISISMRSIGMICSVYYLFSSDYIATLLGCIADISLVVNAGLAFPVFYSFNNLFREEFWAILGKLKRNT